MRLLAFSFLGAACGTQAFLPVRPAGFQPAVFAGRNRQECLFGAQTWKSVFRRVCGSTESRPTKASGISEGYFNSNVPQSNAIILVMRLTSTWRTFLLLRSKTITLLFSRPAGHGPLFWC